MDRQQFYVTLPSKSSRLDFQSNTPGDFKVRLPHAIELDGTYEVALASITYPFTFHNVPDKRNGFEISIGGSDYTFSIRHGYYSDIKTVVRELNSRIASTRLLSKLYFQYDEHNGSVSVTFAEYGWVSFPEPSVLGLLLGFPTDVKIIRM